MKIAIVILLFIVSLLVQLAPVDVFAPPPMTHRDSVEAEMRTKALADFENSRVEMPMRHLDCNFYYAEEVLFARYGIKANMYNPPMTCGTVSFLRESCYQAVIDSLLFAKCGTDIYERLTAAAVSLEKKFPERYPKDQSLICFRETYDLDSVTAILAKHVQYPETARRDAIQGTVYVRAEYDSTGTIVASSVEKSIRPDLDSAAMAGVLHIGKVNPEFRWGQCEPGACVIPVRFVLKP